MAVEITLAGTDRRSVLSSVLGRAFVDEPMLRWPLGVHGDLGDRFTLCFEYFLEDLEEIALVFEAGDAAGAAIWIPAGQHDAQQEAQTQSRMHTLTEDDGRRFERFWAWVESKVPGDPLWHLDSIGVEPGLQGRGIGRALMEHGLARARAAEAGVLLETGNPRNVPYYERFGFHTYDQGDAPNGGPRIWFMRWDP